VSLRVYLDTNVVIRGMERTDAGADEVGRLVALAERGKLALVTSELALGEALIGPLKSGDDLLAESYLDFLAKDPLIELLPVTREVLIDAARIRARSSADFMDALHAATAKRAGCDAIISYDRRLRGLADLDVVEPSAPLFSALDAQRHE
jgi:predicted nucleic acid-binding protein